MHSSQRFIGSVVCYRFLPTKPPETVRTLVPFSCPPQFKQRRWLVAGNALAGLALRHSLHVYLVGTSLAFFVGGVVPFTARSRSARVESSNSDLFQRARQDVQTIAIDLGFDRLKHSRFASHCGQARRNPARRRHPGPFAHLGTRESCPSVTSCSSGSSSATESGGGRGSFGPESVGAALGFGILSYGCVGAARRPSGKCASDWTSARLWGWSLSGVMMIRPREWRICHTSVLPSSCAGSGQSTVARPANEPRRRIQFSPSEFMTPATRVGSGTHAVRAPFGRRGFGELTRSAASNVAPRYE